RVGMKMQDALKRAGILLLAMVLVMSALPARGEEETGQTAQPSKESGQQQPPADEKEAAKPAPPAPAPSSVANIIVPPESTTPPKNLRKVGNHWTPYQPPDPESFPEGAQVHVIVPGDTLWGMAGTHFQNPYLWPQIWNENRYILDSHWIYPGDPLLL